MSAMSDIDVLLPTSDLPGQQLDLVDTPSPTTASLPAHLGLVFPLWHVTEWPDSGRRRKLVSEWEVSFDVPGHGDARSTAEL